MTDRITPIGQVLHVRGVTVKSLPRNKVSVKFSGKELTLTAHQAKSLAGTLMVQTGAELYCDACGLPLPHWFSH
jgi:hypothetical protein